MVMKTYFAKKKKRKKNNGYCFTFLVIKRQFFHATAIMYSIPEKNCIFETLVQNTHLLLLL